MSSCSLYLIPFSISANDEIQTLEFKLVSQVLYHYASATSLSFNLIFFSSASYGIQTLDLRCMSQTLYHCATGTQACHHAVLFAIFILSPSGWI
jgi:hypothetical protein